MILLDLSQILYATAMAGTRDSSEINESYLRHLALNSIRANNKKFRVEYGPMVLATDSKESWRKAIFPYYKQSRARNRAKSVLDWKLLFSIMDTIREELKEFFPYPVINVPGAEGDDIIAHLAGEVSESLPVLIVSADKDFGQLQYRPNVRQFDPIRKRWIEISDPKLFLKEHVIRGDVSDGVPNILSRDATFVTEGGRQGKLVARKFDMFMACDPKEYEPEEQRNYHRNFELIALSRTPLDICDKIDAEFQAQQGKDKSRLYKYFIDKQLKHLMQDIGDF